MKTFAEVIEPDKWINYDMLKISINEDQDIEFWAKWEVELDKVTSYLELMLLGSKEIMSTDCGPVISCTVFKKNAISSEFLEVLFKYVEMNREGFRKIAKKHDKVKKTLTPQQEMRLQTFDRRIINAVEELETRAYFQSMIPEKKRSRILIVFLVVAITAGISLAIVRPNKNITLLVLAALAGFATAYANAANDICNCVGTSVGAGVLTLRQAVLWGCVFEVLGCIVLGSQVAKEITKGVIDSTNYIDTPELFAFSMVCVLIGAASTTFVATAYGLPISATHGIIGGLVAVGMTGMGSDSVGWPTVGIFTVGWVAAPLVGGLGTFLLSLLIFTLIQNHDNAAERSKRYQPVFLFICYSVNLCFMFIKGPPFMKIKPEWLAVLVAIGSGIVLTIVTALILRFRRKLQPKEKDDKINEVKAEKDSLISELDIKVLEEPAGEEKMSSGDEEPDTINDIPKFSFRKLSLVRMNPRIHAFIKERKNKIKGPSPTEDPFALPLILSGLSLALAHGGNDVGNAVGPFAAVLAVARDGEVEGKPDPPF